MHFNWGKNPNEYQSKKLAINNFIFPLPQTPKTNKLKHLPKQSKENMTFCLTLSQGKVSLVLQLLNIDPHRVSKYHYLHNVVLALNSTLSHGNYTNFCELQARESKSLRPVSEIACLLVHYLRNHTAPA